MCSLRRQTSQSVSSKSTSITCNFLMKKKQSKASLSPRRARPSPAISWWKTVIVCDSPKKFQVKDVLFKETDWLCFALLCFFHHEIEGDGHALWGDRLALPMRGRDLIMWPKGQWEALQEVTWKGHIQRKTDIATLWKNRPRAVSLKKLRPKSTHFCEVSKSRMCNYLCTKQVLRGTF